ncbi:MULTISPECIES: PTS lactose/cellobiose transporter subunit IIA [Clostridium]|jgi:cellobiose PTS system EIIA component|uniref:PTS system transporter n=2 Tax=root TaxID=1 RepID=R9CE89_9CLOT|nr:MULTISPECIES: PTS lactose/cellobiose transporter subunit IIA [Clostridium]EOR27315.1 PTS system transporter [Clostridium sartagoforme AAU1]KLE15124.1 PTS cellobiose transporter subunit IIA [Clostridium sp. C8]
MEKIIMNLIIFSGEARSYAMEAMQLAKIGQIDEARELLEKSKETLGDAHATQTSLIQKEAAGDRSEVSLLLVHAQDHLMTSIVVKDLAEEIIDLHEKLSKVECKNE